MKIKVALIAILFMSFSPLQSHATEPQLGVGLPVNLLTVPLSFKAMGFTCKSSWDKTSKSTEVFYTCTHPNAEVYIHGNAETLGGDAFTPKSTSYVKFTAKSAKGYENLLWVADRMGPFVGDNSQGAIRKWVEGNYKKLGVKKRMTKKFFGADVVLAAIGAEGRTFEIGKKPS